MEKTIQPTIKVEVSIEEMANWFWMMSVEDKVKFFNSISEQEDDWFGTEPIGRRQLGRVANHPDLSASAKEIIKCLK